MNRILFLNLAALVAIAALSACAPAPSNSAGDPSASAPSASTAPSNPSQGTAPASDASLACSNGATSATLTPQLTEGPYFTANSPEKTSLYEDGMPGAKLVLSGYVYSADCKPVANALLDFWQANANGEYDNSGYTLRGHLFTDANGHYEVTTVVPGLYPGRTEHIHVKVQAPSGKLITSQLFFPGVAQNDSDGIYNAALLLTIQESANEWQAQYNFVVPTS